MKRYDLCYIGNVNNTKRYLPREPYRYKEFADTIVHEVREGETLWQISAKYYTGHLDNPSLWGDIIADFQPEPIIDLTCKLKTGQKIYVPSPDVIQNIILNEDRDKYFQNW